MNLDLTEPVHSDIMDAAAEMLSEMEGLRAIAGATEEKEDDDAGSKDKPRDTHPIEPEYRKKKAYSRNRKKAGSCESLVDAEPDKNFRFQLLLPNEYGIKCRLIQACSDVNLLDAVKECVTKTINKVWDEHKDAIRAHIDNVFK